MIDLQLAESFVHKRHAVMWRRLRPFTLRRFFALLILDSPFLDGGRDVTWADLEAAVAVCALRDPIPHLAAIDRHRTLRGRLLRKLRPGSLERHARRFVAYIRDYHAPPESATGSDGKMAKAPWILRMVETFRRNGRTEAEAWDMPTGEAFFRYATLMELDGAELDLLDEEEKSLLARARATHAARQRALTAKA